MAGVGGFMSLTSSRVKLPGMNIVSADARSYELIGAGVLPSIKIGGSVRVPADALREWIRQQVAGGVDQSAK